MTKSAWSRRQWLSRVSATWAGLALTGRGVAEADTGKAAAPAAAKTAPGAPLALKDYQPKSMLHVPKTRVERSRFPAIDMHSHLTWARNADAGVSVGEE